MQEAAVVCQFSVLGRTSYDANLAETCDTRRRGGRRELPRSLRSCSLMIVPTLGVAALDAALELAIDKGWLGETRCTAFAWRLTCALAIIVLIRRDWARRFPR